MILHLMFPSFSQQVSRPRAKVIHFILNGRPEKLFSHTFSKPLSRSEIESLVEAQWQLGKRPLRFFSLEGVEIMEEELAYVRSGQRIYVSKGEEFDSTRNFGEYELIKPLGEGGFGKVYLAKSHISQELAAIKLLKLDKITGARDIDMVFREIENLRALTHPHIVRILNCYTLSHMQLVVVMEYLSGGDLLGRLKKQGTFDQPTAREIFLQIVEAVDYCHQKNIVHRDLKLENILLASEDQLIVKVADFGISGVADSFNPDLDVGTLKYMAPEVLSRREKINTAGVDVWACGVMLYCMLYGNLPFTGPNNSAIVQDIIAGKFSFPRRPPISNPAKKLISLMLTVDPAKRIQIPEIQNNEWMIKKPIPITELPDPVIELPVPKPDLKENKRMAELKKTAVIPKRLEREKEQLQEQLRMLGRRKQHQELRGAGSLQALSPRYMLPIKCRQEEERQARRKRASLAHGLWK